MSIDWQSTATALQNATASGLDATVRARLLSTLQSAGQLYDHFTAQPGALPIRAANPEFASWQIQKRRALRDVDQASAAADGAPLVAFTPSDFAGYEAAVRARLQAASALPSLTAAQRTLLAEFTAALARFPAAPPEHIGSHARRPRGFDRTYGQIEDELTAAIAAANLWLSING